MTSRNVTCRCKGCGRWVLVVDAELRIIKRRPGVNVEVLADETPEQIRAHDDWLASDRSSSPAWGAFGTNRALYVRCTCDRLWTIQHTATR